MLRGRKNKPPTREVLRAETAGFCMGVVLALQKLDALLERGAELGPIFTLGPIIHNPQVIEAYARKGVSIAESPEDIPPGATVVIRAHGVPKQVEDGLRRRKVFVIDATCPKVKKAQCLIEEKSHEGRMLLLYGEESHPEVKGLLSYAAMGAFLFDSRGKVADYPLEPDKPYCLAAQTTQDREIFDLISRDLNVRHNDVAILHTICDATKKRQQEAVRIAREVDFMVVVGGVNSGNTRRLVKVIEAQETPCVHVETARELPLEKLNGLGRIGLTAGASTPKSLIDEIQKILEKSPQVTASRLSRAVRCKSRKDFLKTKQR